jgi:hypothetical protein
MSKRAEIINAAWIKPHSVKPYLELGKWKRTYHIVKRNIFSVAS